MKVGWLTRTCLGWVEHSLVYTFLSKNKLTKKNTTRQIDLACYIEVPWVFYYQLPDVLAFKGRYVGLEEDRHLLHYRVYSSFAQLTTAQCSQLLDIGSRNNLYIFQNLQGDLP